MGILPIALGFAGDVIENAIRSRNVDRAASQTASLSQPHHTQRFANSIHHLSSSKQEQQAAPMLANMHNDMMRNERFERNRSMGNMFASKA